MADFDEHFAQALHNLSFLEKVNNNLNTYWDWQVTICFYVAVHLINAHLAKKANQHYRSHENVSMAINPFTVLSVGKLSEHNFYSYTSLHNLSKRSRYLIHEDPKKREENPHFTYDKHLAKAVKKLDVLMLFMKNDYKKSFNKIKIDCSELKSAKLNFFEYQKIQVLKS